DPPARPQGDVAQVAHRRRAVADLWLADRRPPRTDALQPVGVVVAAHVEADVALAGRLAQQLGRVGLDAAAGDEQGAARALEGDAAAEAPDGLAAQDANAARVGERQFAR